MADIVRTEDESGQNELSKKYDVLNSKYPRKGSLEPSQQQSSFPNWEISDEERNWADSYLDLGENEELLDIFGEAVRHIGKRGLQLLREQVNKRAETIFEELGKNITLDSLLNLLRNKFQADTLFFEEGARRPKNVEDNYWTGKGNQLALAIKWLRISRSAFKEMNSFQKGEVNKLGATKHWINTNFEAMRNSVDNNENFYRENLGSGISQELVELSAKKDMKDLVFWSSLKGFVDNLELTAEQGNKD